MRIDMENIVIGTENLSEGLQANKSEEGLPKRVTAGIGSPAISSFTI